MMGIDFLVIGAQKSGTTALHEYASRHPQIFLPKGKEAPFFNRDEYYEKGLSYYLRKTFPNKKGAADVWGKVSPQYMCNRKVAERVYSDLPKVKVIALLRDPVKRAVSHYNMAYKRGLETRDINEAFSDLLSPSNIEKSRELVSCIDNETSCYVAWSEYGRILDYYLDLYKAPPEVMYFEDMIADPESFIKNFFSILGVDDGFLPPNLGEKVFSGDGGRIDLMKRFREISLLKSAWRLLPINVRSDFYFFFEQFLSKVSLRFHRGKKVAVSPNGELSDETLDRLRKHFIYDLQLSSSVSAHPKWFL